MPTLPTFITHIDDNLPLLDDAIVIALERLPCHPETRPQLPPRSVLLEVLKEIHQERMGRLQVGEYLALNRTRKLFESLVRRPEALGVGPTRAITPQIREGAKDGWRLIEQRIHMDVDSARERENNRYLLHVDIAEEICDESWTPDHTPGMYPLTISMEYDVSPGWKARRLYEWE